MPAFAVAADRSDQADAGDFAPGAAAAPVPFWGAVGRSLDAGMEVQQLGARDNALATAFLQRDNDIEAATGTRLSTPPILMGDSDGVNTASVMATFPDAAAAYEAKVDQLRASHPEAMAGIETADQIRARVSARLNQVAALADQGAAQHPLGAFLGGAVGSLADPLNLAVGAATGGAGESLPLIGRMIAQSAVWGSLAAAEAPLKHAEAETVGGPKYGLDEALSDIAGGLAAGPIFEGGGFLLHKFGAAAADRLWPGLKAVFAGDDAARGALDAAGQIGRDRLAVNPQRDGADYEAGADSLARGTPPPAVEPDAEVGDLFGQAAPPPGPATATAPVFAESPAGSALFERAEYRGRGIYAGTFDPAALQTDPATFQYKSDGDAQGVTDRLRGVQAWDPTSSGKVIVYQDANGGLTIADGHQRLGLANRLAGQGFEPRLDGYLFRQADGWSPRDVRTIAALKNIREGQGNPLDAAKVLRDNPHAINDDSLPVSGDFIRQAKGLANLSPEAFGAVVNKVIPERYAALIGQLAGTRPDLHAGMVRLLKAGEPANLDEAHALIHEALEDDWIKGEGEQSDLFGDTQAQSLAIGRAKLQASLIRSLRGDTRLFGQLVRHADAIEAGGNTLARDANEAELATNNAALEIISKLGMRSGELGEAMTEGARRITEGGKVADAARPILARIKSALANGEKLDLARSELLTPAQPLHAAESAAERFGEVGGEGQAGQIAGKPEDLPSPKAPEGERGAAELRTPANPLHPEIEAHPGLFDDIPDATPEEAAFEHLRSCAPG